MKYAIQHWKLYFLNTYYHGFQWVLYLSFSIASSFCLPSSLHAQAVIYRRDPVIIKMLNEVSTENIENTIRTLVGFHTRHSLSDTTSNTRGIGAARRWIKAELHRYLQAGTNRLKVEFDPFLVKPDGKRIPYMV